MASQWRTSRDKIRVECVDPNICQTVAKDEAKYMHMFEQLGTEDGYLGVKQSTSVLGNSGLKGKRRPKFGPSQTPSVTAGEPSRLYRALFFTIIRNHERHYYSSSESYIAVQALFTTAAEVPCPDIRRTAAPLCIPDMQLHAMQSCYAQPLCPRGIPATSTSNRSFALQWILSTLPSEGYHSPKFQPPARARSCSKETTCNLLQP